MTDFTLTRVRYLGMAASIVMVLLSLGFIAAYGLQLSIDFTGGLLLDISIPTLAGASELNVLLAPVLPSMSQLTETSSTGQWQLLLPAGQEMINPQLLISQINEQLISHGSIHLSDGATLLQSTAIGPQVGAALYEQGGLALLAASLSIMCYLAVRFEWRLSVAAMASLVHDAVITLGLLALLQVRIDLNVLAGLLAVIGYSLNDSIVIADRLRDVLKAKPNLGIHECTDMAVKATFSRTLITAGTTLFTIGCLLLLGGEALYGFAFTMFVGVLAGTWSSITIASTTQELLGLTPADYQPNQQLMDERP
ncbi:protein translocase subunit SecF [Shewanella submarina]|uniref:Protein translocase subunit SecF n=1 Tax=Shewanella submarina TaxID=2016376 RepID=A0ABV7GGQ9_9GAMM|nr:protein translocase subunit SecF [Shewanella submarina]MCL1039151.1 protein translocase subunit SecF [Shewanella submarina]